MGDKTIKKTLQKVRKDKTIDAIILRIESGGGSALASDQIWKEISNIVDNDEKEEDSSKDNKSLITVNFEETDISDVFNSILMAANLQAKIEKNIIFIKR